MNDSMNRALCVAMAMSAVMAAVGALGACSPGKDAARADATEAGSGDIDSGIGVDANGFVAIDSSAPIDAASGGEASAGACNTATAWPAMLAAPILPAFAAANLAFYQKGGGPFGVQLAYAESVNCPLVLFSDAGPSPAAFGAYGYWGANEDVTVAVDPSTSFLTWLLIGGAYTGRMSFKSQPGGPYGDHTYVLGVGKLDRDGNAMTIDWTNPMSQVNELFDGIRTTFVPTYPPAADCLDASGTPFLDAGSWPACTWGSAASDSDAGPGQFTHHIDFPLFMFSVGFNADAQGGLPGWIEMDLDPRLESAIDAGAD
jgi:hypothetical protein